MHLLLSSSGSVELFFFGGSGLETSGIAVTSDSLADQQKLKNQQLIFQPETNLHVIFSLAQTREHRDNWSVSGNGIGKERRHDSKALILMCTHLTFIEANSMPGKIIGHAGCALDCDTHTAREHNSGQV